MWQFSMRHSTLVIESAGTYESARESKFVATGLYQIKPDYAINKKKQKADNSAREHKFL